MTVVEHTQAQLQSFILFCAPPLPTVLFDQLQQVEEEAMKELADPAFGFLVSSAGAAAVPPLRHFL